MKKVFGYRKKNQEKKQFCYLYRVFYDLWSVCLLVFWTIMKKLFLGVLFGAFIGVGMSHAVGIESLTTAIDK